MISEAKKRKLAAAQKLKEKEEAEKKALAIERKEVTELVESLETAAKYVADLVESQKSETPTQEYFTQLNSQIVKLLQSTNTLVERSEELKPLDTVAVKNLKEIVIPDTIKIANPTEIPSDLAKSADIRKFADQIERALKATATTDTPKLSQKAADFIPFRRVIKRGTRLEFDDSVPTSGGFAPISGGGGGGDVSFDGTPVTAANPLPVDAEITIPPVTVDTTGLATDTGQNTGNASLASIDGNVIKADTDNVTIVSMPAVSVDTTGLATETKQDTGNTSLASIDTKLDAVTTPSDTQPVSASSLPLPTGAATGAKQDSGNTSLSNIDSNIGAKADASATTDTGTFSLTSLFKRLLEKMTTLVAKDFSTSAKQDTGNTSLASIDTKVDALTTPSDTQPVSASSLPLPTGAATAANQQTDGLTDTQLRATPVDVDTGLTQPTTPSDTQPVSNAGTFAVQATGNVAHDAVDSGSPAKIGGFAKATAPTAVADSDRVNAWFSPTGELMVQAGATAGAATPTRAHLMGITDGVNMQVPKQFATGTQTFAGLIGTVAMIQSATTTAIGIGSGGFVADGSNGSNAAANANYLLNISAGTWERMRSANNIVNSSGTGIALAANVAQFDDVSPTPITENNFGNMRISSDRSLLVTPRSVTPTQTSVAASASSVAILAANANRKGATIYNDSTVTVNIILGSTASSTSFTVKLQADDYYEVPFGYIGAIAGIWASATGSARITELV